MNIFSSLSNFLYDKDYFITLFDNEIYIYNYIDLLFLGDTKIKVSINDFKLVINGENLCIKQLDKKEMLIAGLIKGVTKDYE